MTLPLLLYLLLYLLFYVKHPVAIDVLYYEFKFEFSVDIGLHDVVDVEDVNFIFVAFEWIIFEFMADNADSISINVIVMICLSIL